MISRTRMHGFGWKRSALAALAVAPIWCAQPAAAQSFPSQTIRVIVPFGPGGLPDVLGRLVAEGLKNKYGRPAIVENKPGAAGALGAEFVKNATPDGHVLLLADNAVTAINKNLRSDLPYDPIKDFVPVTEITSNPFFLFAGTRLGVNSASELIALLKSKPGALNYSSAGDGSLHHLCTALFLELTGTNATHVQYRTSSDAAKAMVAEEVEVTCGAKAAGRQMIGSGKVKPIAVALEEPNSLDPAVPTLKQQTGIGGLEIVARVGLMAPAGTPRTIVDQLARDVAEIFRTDEKAKEIIANQDAQAVLAGPDAYASVIRHELDKFARIVKMAGAGAK